MQRVADGLEHREAVLVVSADDSIYLSEMPFYLRGRTARIREIWLRLILSPSAILVSRDGEAFEIKTMSEVWKIERLVSWRRVRQWRRGRPDCDPAVELLLRSNIPV
jgi:hypothetical protein